MRYKQQDAEMLRRRIAELEASLQRTRDLEGAQRRRADALEQQVRIAFRVSGWPTRTESPRT